MRDTYREALARAEKDLLELERQRDRMNFKIARIKQTIAGLTALCNETRERKRPRLAESLRLAMQENPEFLSPAQWRDKVAERGFPLGTFNDPLVLCRATLKRFRKSGDVEVRTVAGRRVYGWGRTQGTGPIAVGGPKRKPSDGVKLSHAPTGSVLS